MWIMLKHMLKNNLILEFLIKITKQSYKHTHICSFTF